MSDATRTLHPDDATLMAIASGDEGAVSSSAAHLAHCPVCRAEVEAFRAACAVGPAAPSPFETSRAERDLLRAIDGDAVARRRAWRPAAVAAAVLLSASTGALGASIVLRAGDAPRGPTLGPTPASVQQPAVPRVGPARPALSRVPPAPAPAPALLGPPARPVPSSGPASPARVRAAPAVAVDEPALEEDAAQALRTRCEQGLLHARDRAAVEACRAFALQFPADPAVRVLAYAAGRVAEDELDDPALAEQEYERALLLSPFSGAPATDALWARARVRARQGELDEARADLRLYIAQVPSARHDDAVLALARELGLVP